MQQPCPYLEFKGRYKDCTWCTARGKQVRPKVDCTDECPVIKHEASRASQEETSAMSDDTPVPAQPAAPAASASAVSPPSPAGKGAGGLGAVRGPGKGIPWDSPASDFNAEYPSNQTLREYCRAEVERRGKGGRAFMAKQLDIAGVSLKRAIAPPQPHRPTTSKPKPTAAPAPCPVPTPTLPPIPAPAAVPPSPSHGEGPGVRSVIIVGAEGEALIALAFIKDRTLDIEYEQFRRGWLVRDRAAQSNQ